MAIVKILSRHNPSYGSLIQYVLRYIADDKKGEKTQVFTSNMRSSDIKGFVRELIANEAFRRFPREDQIHLFHEIVSFGDEDREAITPEILEDLAREYMRLRGETALMVGAPHYDQDHLHLHFCVSALQYRTGISAGLNREQLRELKERFQEYHKEKYPQLTKSFPEHGKGGRYVDHAAWHKDHRSQIMETVRACFAQAQTHTEFLASLRDHNLPHYERGGKPAGIEYDGGKFRFSRLLDEGQTLESLPVERSEEEHALEAIRAARARQRERDERGERELGLKRER